VRLHGAAERVARERGIESVLVTVAHTHEHAVANAVALAQQAP
jgi:phosphopantetheinyl transferase (holo-ACP synthase)